MVNELNCIHWELHNIIKYVDLQWFLRTTRKTATEIRAKIKVTTKATMRLELEPVNLKCKFGTENARL